MKKFAIYTLGCKLNFSESSSISRLFFGNGFERVEFGEPSDVVIINTCTVTEAADKKCRQAIKKAVKTSPFAIVAVVGCYAQLKPGQIDKIEGVDIILDQKEKFRLLEYVRAHTGKKLVQTSDARIINEFYPTYSSGDRTRSFFKVQDGCDYFCAYCTVPLARGKSRSGTIDQCVRIAYEIAEKGMKEIILTGINLGDFGKGTDESLLGLIRALENVEGIERFRISSVEPNLLTDEIIDFVAESGKFMPHFHIPLQSGSDKILQLMGRRYDTVKFRERIARIRKNLPDAFIGIDVIVGVSGETEDDFEDSYNFISNIDFSELHVFSYSERDNTRATGFEMKVSVGEKKSLSQRLLTLSENKLKKFYKSGIGKTTFVLFEDFNDKGKMYGYTENYIKVETDYNASLANEIKKVRLTGLTDRNTMKIDFVK